MINYIIFDDQFLVLTKLVKTNLILETNLFMTKCFSHPTLISLMTNM